jgi:hypothetical protein
MLEHLWRALRHALGKILGWAGVAFLATALLVELIAFLAAGADALVALTTHLAALALAIAVGYVVGFTVLVEETISLLARGAHDLEHSGGTALKRLERIKQPQ